jgi:hypothetical protein
MHPQRPQLDAKRRSMNLANDAWSARAGSNTSTSMLVSTIFTCRWCDDPLETSLRRSRDESTITTVMLARRLRSRAARLPLLGRHAAPRCVCTPALTRAYSRRSSSVMAATLSSVEAAKGQTRHCEWDAMAVVECPRMLTRSVVVPVVFVQPPPPLDRRYCASSTRRSSPT